MPLNDVTKSSFGFKQSARIWLQFNYKRRNGLVNSMQIHYGNFIFEDIYKTWRPCAYYNIQPQQYAVHR